ncbi:MAG: tyrosine-protein phosphatase [Firmicutes bacterium]|nr:tyrosine-protein phosphatase [Bacillota bacterium]
MSEDKGYTVQKLPRGGWLVKLSRDLDAPPKVYLSVEPEASGITPSHSPLPWQANQCWVAEVPREQRTYLHVRFPNGRVDTIADRILPLEGGFNFRDLGGYPSQNGQTVRWGKLYRSGRLSQLTQWDQVYIQQLRIHTICDLRTAVESEKDRTPPDLAKEIRHLSLNLSQNHGTHDNQGTYDEVDQALVLSLVRDNYRAFTESREAYREFFHLLLTPDPAPILFHCTAGKDRTGVTAALLLWALGVSWDVIVQDFEISNQFTKQLFQLITTTGDEDPSHPLWPMARAYPENLEAAIAAIVAEYGNLDRFFVKGLELEPGWKETLQEKYLIPQL